ncbi:MAG: hypothetical protein AMJ62_14915 [Myxococcales bacterium SG8_38]|nr:MAG: hypothetical protein AMJ62_14915 [Myxococcales bacterium SG8_38]
MRRWIAALCAATILAGYAIPSLAFAEEEAGETPPPPVEAARPEPPSKDAADNYGLAYAGRELTMPRGMVRGTFDVSTLHFDLGFFGSENFVSLNFGAAISPVDDLELGFSRYRMGSFPGINFIDLVNLGGSGLISAFVSPEGDFGDIPFYIRYQPVSGTADVALEFRLRIPTLSEFGLAFGLPVRIHAGDSVAIDTGFDLTFDDPGGLDVLSVGVPLQIVGNVSDNLFLELQTGVSLPDITTDPVVTVLPLGFRLGGSVDAGRVMLDAFFNFRFPTFAAFGSGDSEVTTEIWTITVGINVYSPVLF